LRHVSFKMYRGRIGKVVQLYAIVIGLAK